MYTPTHFTSNSLSILHGIKHKDVLNLKDIDSLMNSQSFKKNVVTRYRILKTTES